MECMDYMYLIGLGIQYLNHGNGNFDGTQDYSKWIMNIWVYIK